MQILALDPALNSFGYAIFKIEGGKFFYVTSGTFKSNPDFSLLQKLSFMQNKIIDIIQKNHISQIVFEESFVNQNPSSSLKLGILRGVIYSLSILYKIKIDSFAATTIKKTVAGNGRANKDAILESIGLMIPNLEIKTLDESDAIATGLTFVILNRLL